MASSFAASPVPPPFLRGLTQRTDSSSVTPNEGFAQQSRGTSWSRSEQSNKGDRAEDDMVAKTNLLARPYVSQERNRCHLKSSHAHRSRPFVSQERNRCDQ